MRTNIIKNIIIITLFFFFVLLFINIFSKFININNIENNNFYIIENDKIPSIYRIVGKRELYNYKTYKKNGIYTTIYEYKNIKNVKSDLSEYISELKNNYNYVYTSNINLNNYNEEISLSTNSIDNSYIIIIKISYSNSKYKISISKGKGNIKVFK